MKSAFDKIVERLEEERKEVTKWDSNKHYIYKEGADWMGNKAIEIVNQVAEEYNQSWIPCVNELPQEYTDVLGCDYDGYIYVVELFKDSIYGKIWRQWNGGMLRLGAIIAWQPLPAPYKPKEEK